jgi:hypothetical protein
MAVSNRGTAKAPCDSRSFVVLKARRTEATLIRFLFNGLLAPRF